MEKDTSSPQVNPESNLLIQDLESVLRKGLGNNDLQLVNYTATNFLPPGDNYGSRISKLDVTIRKTDNDPEEILHLVAKMPTSGDRPILAWSNAFAKEVFTYSELVPIFQSLEKEMGVKDVQNLLPSYAGHRRSLDEASDKIDENSLLLIENLKVSGYYVADRHKGLDLEKSRMVSKRFARFHALGVVFKHKRPDLFERAKNLTLTDDIDYEQFNVGLNSVLRFFRNNARFAKYLAKIEACFSGELKAGRTPGKAVQEPWATFIHADFWVPNVLFHNDSNGIVDDVRLIDFQMLLYDSPLIDLSNLLGASVDAEVLNRVDELLDLYYETFVATLERMGFDSTVFSRTSFDAELKRQSISEFPWNALATQFSIFEAEETAKDSKEVLGSVLNCESNEMFKERMVKLIECYEKMRWF